MSCPHCGYCEHCGRSNHYYRPYPWYYTYAGQLGQTGLTSGYVQTVTTGPQQPTKEFQAIKDAFGAANKCCGKPESCPNPCKESNV